MSLEKIVQEAMAGRPLEMKEAFQEEIQTRMANALEEKFVSVMEAKSKDADEDDADDDDDEDDEKDDDDSSKSGKPDFLDMDKDGDKEETMKKAIADKKAAKNESMSEDEVNEMIDNMSEETLASFMEEIEQLDELSPTLMNRYANTAKADVDARAAKTDINVARGKWSKSSPKVDKQNSKNTERTAFAKLALAKAAKKDARTDGAYDPTKHYNINRKPTSTKMKESMSEDELLDIIESMSENELLDMIESVSDETLQEGPFKGVGKMMMNRKLNKSAKNLDKAYDDNQSKKINVSRSSSEYGTLQDKGYNIAGQQGRIMRASDRLNKSKNAKADIKAAAKKAAAKKAIFPFNNR